MIGLSANLFLDGVFFEKKCLGNLMQLNVGRDSFCLLTVIQILKYKDMLELY